MAKKTSNESSISDVLKEILEKNKLQSGLDQIDVIDAWSILGSGVKNYTKSISLKGSTLYVELSSAVLREELSLGKSKIISLINEHLKREIINNLIFR
jgi:Dna[CI] antecedent, DciA